MTPPTGGLDALTPLVSFTSAASLKLTIQNSDLAPSFDESLFDSLLVNGLPPLVSPTVLAIILGISPKLITAMARSPRRYYRTFSIAKKNGDQRTIMAPRTFLKATQYYILKFILQKQLASGYATGFVRGKGIVVNARLHEAARYLLNIDIQDFFGSVKLTQVRQVFLRLGFTQATSDTLAQLCTFEGSLPQGAPTSPALSNLVFMENDRAIAELAAGSGVLYSRYADDLTFSGQRPISREMLSDISQLLTRSGFRLNSAKTRFAGPRQPKYVTGLVVNVRAQVDRHTRRKLRAMFHRAATQPELFQGRAAELMGWASYVKSFDAALGLQYTKIAKRLPKD